MFKKHGYVEFCMMFTVPHPQKKCFVLDKDTLPSTELIANTLPGFRAPKLTQENKYEKDPLFMTCFQNTLLRDKKMHTNISSSGRKSTAITNPLTRSTEAHAFSAEHKSSLAYR